MMIISIISLCYEQFRTNAIVALALQVTRAGVAAVIIDVIWNLANNILKTKQSFYIAMMAVCFVAVTIFHVSAMLIILTCLLIGIVTAVLACRKEQA